MAVLQGICKGLPGSWLGLLARDASIGMKWGKATERRWAHWMPESLAEHRAQPRLALNSSEAVVGPQSRKSVSPHQAGRQGTFQLVCSAPRANIVHPPTSSQGGSQNPQGYRGHGHRERLSPTSKIKNSCTRPNACVL